MKYINADILRDRIKKNKYVIEPMFLKGDDSYYEGEYDGYNRILSILDSLRQEQQDEQPEYGYLSIEYVHGKKSRWNVGDVLAYYISTSNEEGEYLLGKIVNVEFDEEEGWVYTFEDEGALEDEQSLVEEGAYKKN